MKIVLLVHGYNGVPKIYDYLKNKLSDLGYQVIVPSFPTQEKITFEGYCAVFDKYRNIFDNKPIIVAHSIGNEMVLKYICLYNYEVELFISLAGFSHPFVVDGRDELNRVLASVSISKDEKEQCVNLISKRVSIYSDNDHIVPLWVLREFCNDIQSKSLMIPGIGHMGSKSGVTELPEVVDIISWKGVVGCE